MTSKWLTCSVVVVVALLALPAGSAVADPYSGAIIVRIRPLLPGLPTILNVCNLIGCTVEASLDTPPELGLLQPSSLFRVRLAVPTDLGVLLLITSPLGVLGIEPDLKLPLSKAKAQESSPAVQDYLWRRDLVEYFATTVWTGYLQQPAASIVRLHEAQCDLRATGDGVVAVIDTGVDVEHPALASRLVEGYDFTRNAGGGNERDDVQQASGVDVYRVNDATVAAVNQASVAVLDPEHPGYGHGTMVAGVIHLVAPTARLMPLKAFRADGTGYTSDVLRAIHYAVRGEAKILNMSFGRPTNSPEMAKALDHARQRGVIPLSSAGNDGASVPHYPATLASVMGIASTSDQDVRSDFSNYGSNLVWVAAPGEGIVTTYPGSTYAAVWGTSFSTPFASGAAALLVGLRSNASYADVSWAIAQAIPVPGELGYGRLDLYQSVQAGRGRWEITALPPGPAASCQLY